MSTVLITPTHVASDHCVVVNTYPSQTVIDPNYPKLFVSPDSEFIIALCGDYTPAKIHCPNGYAFAKATLNGVIAKGFGAEESIEVGDETWAQQFNEIFEKAGMVFILTSDFRCAIYCGGADKQTLKAKRLSDYVGVGSGGTLGSGMLIGGADINEVWTKINQLVGTSSIAHTVIPLEILKPFTLTLDKEAAQ